MSSANSSAGVVIVGAGHAGAQAALALRQGGYTAPVTMLTTEPELPYERPPLSKEYLAGERAFDNMLIRSQSFWDEHRIGVRTACRVVSIDSQARRVGIAGGEMLNYQNLIWAGGGNARRLTCAGGDLAGVHSVRTRADVDQLRTEIESARRVAVVGGGYIGLEAAAVLNKLGKQVVVLEALDRVLARVAGPQLSKFYEDEHRAHGVDVRTSCAVDSLLGERGRVCGVRLSDGTILDADIVIVGIGIVPNIAPLIDAGAAGSSAGVRIDEYCRTTLPGIHAVGDCALHVNRWADGAEVRIESVQNAVDQATVAAKDVLGAPTPYQALPWFWSNQYDLRLQTIGLSLGHDSTAVRGIPASHSFSIVYLKRDRVVALDCVNAPRDYAFGRKLVSGGLSPDPARLGNPAVSLKDLCG
ncbi:pyridine nucleotide-disulfide oxidoreductase [Steroidobacter agaridevorans]|uniref:Pyridine nucleotide-disulfide oxidoreductase n=1 Tax=Steroidobacter agaridevorans TaxID=2695856 RepID=A0A829YH31_9GAMM|nr:FAD-dependent oxidoreductase [Steroidobacter agaridevorans]GFE82042.1 pyridine nucleotide-disulfide oxidoreductase [Steroidobacter agaridevorans]